MSTRLARSPLPALAVALGLLWLAPTCLAAGPIKGGRYAGSAVIGFEHWFLAFNVDDRGWAFVSDPRLVFEGSETGAPCIAGPWDLGGFQRPNASHDFQTVSDGTPVRIGADGSFGLSASIPRGGGRAALSLTGRFLGSGRRAKGVVRISAPPCMKHARFSARFTGQQHLSDGSCTPTGTQTLADDDVRRVYRERYVYDPVVRNLDGGYGNGYALYGCDRRTQRRWFLAGDDTSNGLADNYSCSEHFVSVALAGHLAALVLNDVCQAGGVQEVRIVDLNTGAVRLNVVPYIDHGSTGTQHLETLVIAPTGSAAWIVCARQTHICQVIEEIAYGPGTLIDQSDQVDPNSLTLDGTTLSWRNNGETKTATLG